YDGYLAEVATTRGLEAMFERALEESQRAAAAAAEAMPSAPPSARGVTAPPPSVRGVSTPPRGPSPEEMRARREALAKRLLGGSGRPPSPSQPAEERQSHLRYSNPSDAMDAIKRRYEERVENATLAQAKRYIDEADAALEKKDIVQAASMLSIAVK